MIFGGDDTTSLSTSVVRFTPGARTNWHSHPHVQLLVCTDGTGLVANRDGETIVLRAGEAVWTPPGEEHWHGGTSTTMLCHHAIVDGSGPDGPAVWLEPVTDEQYTSAHSAAGV